MKDLFVGIIVFIRIASESNRTDFGFLLRFCAIGEEWFGSSIVCFGDHITSGLIDWLIGD